jgi:hypothetical protein
MGKLLSSSNKRCPRLGSRYVELVTWAWLLLDRASRHQEREPKELDVEWILYEFPD